MLIQGEFTFLIYSTREKIHEEVWMENFKEGTDYHEHNTKQQSSTTAHVIT